MPDRRDKKCFQYKILQGFGTGKLREKNIEKGGQRGAPVPFTEWRASGDIEKLLMMY
jgi:hypothetical protein